MRSRAISVLDGVEAGAGILCFGRMGLAAQQLGSVETQRPTTIPERIEAKTRMRQRRQKPKRFQFTEQLTRTSCTKTEAYLGGNWGYRSRSREATSCLGAPGPSGTWVFALHAN